MVGGRSYNQSQFNRAIDARRQPGSVFKPFVFLAAFERAAEEGRTDLTPASLTRRRARRRSTFDDQVWEPKNYDDYDGEITLAARAGDVAQPRHDPRRRADRLRQASRRSGARSASARRRRRFPSITLGVFELTPLEVAQAYTLFTNGGSVRPLHAIDHIAGRRAAR